MSNLSLPLRRLISGPKARFVQDGVDLDLTYITDRLIIMAYPASGVATLWRNSRKVVRDFLDERHGDRWRVYNFCPTGENRYDGDEFHNRVSRYPFPDHHVPPLSLIPMVVADLTAWFAEHPKNVAVIHCKAGKGRSGTLACCYLVSLPKLPPPPQDPRNLGTKRQDTVAVKETPDQRGEESGESRPEPSSLRVRARRSFSAIRSRTSVFADQSSEELSEQQQSSKLRRPSLAFLRKQPSERKISQPVARPPPLPPNAVQNVRSFSAMGSSSTPSSLGESLGASASDHELLALQNKLEAVFDFHTSRRLKPEKLKHAASLSQARTRSTALEASRQQGAGNTLSRASLDVRPSGPSEWASRQSVDRAAAASTPCLLPHPPRLAIDPPSPLSPTFDTPAAVSASQTAESSAPSEQQRAQRLAFAIPSSPSRRSGAKGSSCRQDDDRLRKASSSSLVDPRPRHLRAAAGPLDSRSALGVLPQGKSSETLLYAATPTPPRHTAVGPDASMYNSTEFGSKASSRRASSDLAAWGRRSIEALRLSSPYSSSIRQRSSSALTSRSEATSAYGDMGQDSVYDQSREDISRADSGEDSHGTINSNRSRRIGVSIASQRRWVGYWGRMLRSEDPRATLDFLQPSQPGRLIRITGLSVLQDPKRSQAEGKKGIQTLAKLDTYHVTIGRYQNALVEKIEGWERGARRRARAFGLLDPGARAPEIVCGSAHTSAASRKGESSGSTDLCRPPSCVPGEEQWDNKHSRPLEDGAIDDDADGEKLVRADVRSRSRRPSSADWRQCGRYNSYEAARSRLAQHGNDEGVGDWGINVVSEAERCRHFDWPDERGGDDSDRAAESRYRFIEWGPKLKSSTPEYPPQDDDDAASAEDGVWHHFNLNGSSVGIDDDKIATGSDRLASVWSDSSNALRNRTSPPTPPHSSRGEEASSAGHDESGLVVSPDREICIKIQLANKALSLLPDIAGSAGWAWFIPAFEDPSSSSMPSLRHGLRQSSGCSAASSNSRQGPTRGARTTVVFERDEIDFAKKVAGVKAIRVEWEWVRVAHHFEEDDEEELDDGDDDDH
ncbi:unnamed protein product [Parajaminaea phylloscopi]